MKAPLVVSPGALWLIALSACVSSKPPEPSPVAPATAPAAAGGEPVAPAPEPTHETPPASSAQAQNVVPADPPRQAASPPSKQPALGAVCTPSTPAPGTVDGCGKKGRVSLVFDARLVFLVRDATCKPVGLHHQGVYAPSACVSGDELWAASECIACRMMGSGWSAHGKISELTSDQAVELQKRLGLDAARALALADDWKRAIEQAREKQSE